MPRPEDARADGVPREAGGVPREADGVPREAGGVPREAGGVPREADGVPREAGGVPGTTPRPTETWLRIVQVHDRISHRVDSALHTRHDLSLTGFEALRRLAESPGERASMGQLADALGLSRAGVTSTVSRLVQQGLVRRERGGRDRRLLHACLTPAGRERVAPAAATHDDLVAQLLTRLGDDAPLVTDALARVSAGNASSP